jgi:hypothetical protein
MRYSRPRGAAAVLIGFALVAALASQVHVVADAVPGLFRMALVAAAMAAVAWGFGLGDSRKLLAPIPAMPGPHVLGRDPDRSGPTFEQLEGRLELRRTRRAAYLKSRYGDEPVERVTHDAFSPADQMRRRQLVEEGGKRLAEVEAEMFRRADELQKRRQAVVDAHQALRAGDASDVDETSPVTSSVT